MCRDKLLILNKSRRSLLILSQFCQSTTSQAWNVRFVQGMDLKASFHWDLINSILLSLHTTTLLYYYHYILCRANYILLRTMSLWWRNWCCTTDMVLDLYDAHKSHEFLVNIWKCKIFSALREISKSSQKYGLKGVLLIGSQSKNICSKYMHHVT